MVKKSDLRDPVDAMHFKESMKNNWCQKKYRAFAKQLEEFAPFSYGRTALLQGLCALNGWGVRKDRETARKFFSQLYVGKIVWFGHHYYSFMECEVLKIEEDRVLLWTKDPEEMRLGYGNTFVFPPAQNVSWDRCLARKWMNTDYFQDSFYKQERDQILKVTLTTPPNPFTDSKVQVKEFKDKLFPLSIQEYMEYKELNRVIPAPVGWTFTKTGPKAIYDGGRYINRITTDEAEYKTVFLGSDGDALDKTNLDEKKGSFFRTAGSTVEKRAFVVGDYIFWEGESKAKVQCSNIKLGYNPAFWVKLK